MWIYKIGTEALGEVSGLSRIFSISHWYLQLSICCCFSLFVFLGWAENTSKIQLKHTADKSSLSGWENCYVLIKNLIIFCCYLHTNLNFWRVDDNHKHNSTWTTKSLKHHQSLQMQTVQCKPCHALTLCEQGKKSLYILQLGEIRGLKKKRKLKKERLLKKKRQF